MKVRLEFKPQDCWVGVFWKTTPKANYQFRTDVWVCVLPMLPIHLSWFRSKKAQETRNGRSSDARSSD